MSEYRFVTTWRLKAPIEAVWERILESEGWPDWWKGVEDVVELVKGDEDGLGNLRRYTWKSALPYRLIMDIKSTRFVRHQTIEGVISGDVEGQGNFHFSQEGEVVTLRYEMTVRTTKLWMGLIAPLAKPLFRWNHHVIMRWGGEGLARSLGAELVSCEDI